MLGDECFIDLFGVEFGWCYIVIELVGFYVFGGIVVYLFLVLMNVVFVKVVGVVCFVMVVLVFDGKFNLLVLVVVYFGGVSEIYCVGGV